MRQDEKVRKVVICEKDYKNLLESIEDKDFRLYVETLWETGCRPNEIVGLRREDIYFIVGTTRIYQNKTKNLKTVYFPDALLEKFGDIEGYICDGSVRNKEYYSKKFKDLREKLGMRKEYCLYAFWHSCGTRILNKTKDIHLVSKLLGNSDIRLYQSQR